MRPAWVTVLASQTRSAASGLTLAAVSADRARPWDGLVLDSRSLPHLQSLQEASILHPFESKLSTRRGRWQGLELSSGLGDLLSGMAPVEKALLYLPRRGTKRPEW